MTEAGAARERCPCSFMSDRVPVSLACSECESRNYRTSRKREQKGQITLSKFCPKCKKHTVHKETK